LLNITNPMTCLTRAVARERSVKVVGLCHEVVIMSWFVAIACGVQATDVEFSITGVNHLPWITSLSIEGDDDGFARLRRVLASDAGAQWFLDEHALKLALLDRYGALPGAGDRHVAEFFPWALIEASDWGKAWGIHLTSISDRERDEAGYRQSMLDVIDGGAVPTWASGEMVAPVIDSLVTGERRELPLNLPNEGQAPYLPDDAVVETMCVVDGDGVRGREAIVPPEPCAEWIRRHVAVQELTMHAALSGDREAVHAAMALDPLCGRIGLREIESMADDLLAATAKWLPQFV
jgi:alpha-galactosidase